MPLYLFNLIDGGREPDTSGSDFPDDAVAKVAAVQHAGEMLSFDPDFVWDHRQLRVEVTNEKGAPRWIISASAVDVVQGG